MKERVRQESLDGSMMAMSDSQRDSPRPGDASMFADDGNSSGFMDCDGHGRSHRIHASMLQATTSIDMSIMQDVFSEQDDPPPRPPPRDPTPAKQQPPSSSASPPHPNTRPNTDTSTPQTAAPAEDLAPSSGTKTNPRRSCVTTRSWASNPTQDSAPSGGDGESKPSRILSRPPASTPLEGEVLEGARVHPYPGKKLTSASSSFRGVSWHAPSRQWRATIFAKAKPRHLGYFHDEVEGARAYDLAAVQLRASVGAERYLNFPQDLEAYQEHLEAMGNSYNFDTPGRSKIFRRSRGRGKGGSARTLSISRPRKAAAAADGDAANPPRDADEPDKPKPQHIPWQEAPHSAPPEHPGRPDPSLGPTSQDSSAPANTAAQGARAKLVNDGGRWTSVVDDSVHLKHKSRQHDTFGSEENKWFPMSDSVLQSQSYNTNFSDPAFADGFPDVFPLSCDALEHSTSAHGARMTQHALTHDIHMTNGARRASESTHDKLSWERQLLASPHGARSAAHSNNSMSQSHSMTRHSHGMQHGLADTDGTNASLLSHTVNPGLYQFPPGAISRSQPHHRADIRGYPRSYGGEKQAYQMRPVTPTDLDGGRFPAAASSSASYDTTPTGWPDLWGGPRSLGFEGSRGMPTRLAQLSSSDCERVTSLDNCLAQLQQLQGCGGSDFDM